MVLFSLFLAWTHFEYCVMIVVFKYTKLHGVNIKIYKYPDLNQIAPTL